MGVFFFAVSGSLLAARKNIDIVGSLLLASLVALGGGVIRDLILDSGPPAAFSNPAYLVPPLLATVLVYFLFTSVQRFTSLLILFDAGGLALFCMTGTVKALAVGHESCGGGAPGGHDGGGRRPAARCDSQRGTRTFQPQGHLRPAGVRGGRADLYSVGGGCVQCPDGVAVAAVVFTFRVVAWRRSWQAPLAVHGWHRGLRGDSGTAAQLGGPYN